MIKVKNIEAWGIEHAIRGMRLPMNSWDKSDSCYCSADNCVKSKCSRWGKCCADINKGDFVIGQADLDLMRRLYKAGTEHRKYARQIFVSMDITAPDYWFKEFSTYKVGTVENSTSTMHRIHSKEFTLDDFSCEHLMDEDMMKLQPEKYDFKYFLDMTIQGLNIARNLYLETKDKKYWWQMIQLLPMSYNYRRTVTMNYENVFSIIKQRTGHKLDEWNEFVSILRKLPYVNEIIGEDEHKVAELKL
jgi:hypothetical protein